MATSLDMRGKTRETGKTSVALDRCYGKKVGKMQAGGPGSEGIRG
jgi:hypothetical protein